MKKQRASSSGQIVVLGMHRSGTSCTGNLLTRLGVYFGDESVSTGSSEQNPKGFFERRDLRDICDDILHAAGCDWWSINNFSPEAVPAPVQAKARARFAEVIDELDPHRPWFIKEPRLCLVWPVLASRLANPVFLHVWRNPVEVARSLSVRNGFPIDFGVALWEAYVRSAVAVSRDRPSIVLSYNELIEKPVATTERLVRELKAAGVDGVSIPQQDQLQDAVDARLYRERQAPSDLNELLTSSQREMVRALAAGKLTDEKLFSAVSQEARLRLETGTQQQKDMAVLRQDLVLTRRKVADFGKLRDAAAEREQKLNGLEVLLTEKNSEMDRRAAEHAEKIAVLESKISERDRQIGALRHDVERQGEERDVQRAEASAAGEKVAALTKRLAERDRELEVQRQEYLIKTSQLEAERAASNEAVGSLQGLLDKQGHDLQALRREAADLKERLTKLAEKAALGERRIAELEPLPSVVARLEGEVAERNAAAADGERYIENLRERATAFRAQVERTFSHALEHARAGGKLDLRRAHLILQFEYTSWWRLLFNGAGAATGGKRKVSLSWWALFLHYLIGHRRKDAGDLALIAVSGWFDPKYYLKLSGPQEGVGDPLIHYVDYGVRRGRNPSPSFDSSYYLQTNKDVAASGMNPLVHFIRHGQQEGRAPRPPRALEAFRAAQSAIGSFSMPPLPSRTSHIRAAEPPHGRIVIYTAVAGGYDDLQKPAVMPPDVDFVVFSDRPVDVEGWTTRPLNYFNGDPTRSARFVKLHPHVFFPDYERSIWVDANIGIQGDLRVFLNKLSAESPVAIFAHPLRDCVYVEAQECIKRKKDDADVINRHVELYRNLGVPERMGLWETNVVARRHNDVACIALMLGWWREIEIGSRRDQLSLPVVAERLGVKIAPLGLPGEDARNHPLLTLTKHPANRGGNDQIRLPAAVRRDVDIDAIPIDIGVCVYNSPAETKACLDSVLSARRPQDRLVIVDDASGAETAALLDQVARNRDGITLVRHEQNRGYTHSANDVLKNARSPWVVLLNSDAVVPARAIPKLVTCGEQFPALAVVGPLSNAAGWQTVPQLTGADGKFMVNRLPGSLSVEQMDRLCEELSDGVVPFVPLVNGFCFAMRRLAIEQIGLFDEEKFPVGYGEEDDFCLRAGALGFLCGLATDTYVFHSKSASFTPERRAPLVAQGGKALRMKHSPERVAAAVETMKRHPYLAHVRQRIGEALQQRMPQQEAV